MPSGPVRWPDLRGGGAASDRERPLVTGVNGPLMARRTAALPASITAPWSPLARLDSCHPSGRGRRVKAREATACGLALTRQLRPRQSSGEEGGRCLGVIILTRSCVAAAAATMGGEQTEIFQQEPISDRGPSWAAGKAEVAEVRRSAQSGSHFACAGSPAVQ